MRAKKRPLLATVLSLAVLSGLLAFQNCSSKSDSGGTTSQSSLGDPPPDDDPDLLPEPPVIPPPPSDLWKAGDPYQASKMPYVPKGRLVSDLNTYGAKAGFKAMAVAKNGYGLGLASSQFESQNEANQIVMELCQILANNNHCALFAEGNYLKYGETTFKAAHATVLQSGARSFSVVKIPGLIRGQEYSVESGYAGISSPYKSMAIGMYGKVATAGGATQAEASRRALEKCEAMDAELCTLYAEGNSVRLNVSGWNWNYSTEYIKYGPMVFAANQVPFITDAARAATSAIGTIPNKVAEGKTVVLALSRYGHNAVLSSTTQTVANLKTLAINSCNNQMPGSGVSCFIYSVNNQVMLSRTELANANWP